VASLLKKLKFRKKPPATLYKFFGPERVEICRTLRVRFSQVSALNDPFEFATTLTPDALKLAAEKLARRQFSLPRFIFNGTATAIRKTWGHEALSKMLPVRLLATAIIGLIVPFLCAFIYPFVRRHALIVMRAAGEDMGEIVSKLRDGMMLVFSTTARWDSVPMWAHYAGNHTGFWVGIDPSMAFETASKEGLKFLKPRPVQYRRKTPTFRSGTFDIDDFFSMKMDHWAYEEEWRFLGFPDDSAERLRVETGPEILLFDLRSDAVREVIFGARASYGLIASALKHLTDRQIFPSIYKLSSTTGYGFERIQIEDFLSGPVEFQHEKEIPNLAEVRLDRLEKAMVDMEEAARHHPLFKFGKAK